MKKQASKVRGDWRVAEDLINFDVDEREERREHKRRESERRRARRDKDAMRQFGI